MSGNGDNRELLKKMFGERSRSLSHSRNQIVFRNDSNLSENALALDSDSLRSWSVPENSPRALRGWPVMENTPKNDTENTPKNDTETLRSQSV